MPRLFRQFRGLAWPKGSSDGATKGMTRRFAARLFMELRSGQISRFPPSSLPARPSDWNRHQGPPDPTRPGRRPDRDSTAFRRSPIPRGRRSLRTRWPPRSRWSSPSTGHRNVHPRGPGPDRSPLSRLGLFLTTTPSLTARRAPAEIAGVKHATGGEAQGPCAEPPFRRTGARARLETASCRASTLLTVKPPTHGWVAFAFLLAAALASTMLRPAGQASSPKQSAQHRDAGDVAPLAGYRRAKPACPHGALLRTRLVWDPLTQAARERGAQ